MVWLVNFEPAKLSTSKTVSVAFNRNLLYGEGRVNPGTKLTRWLGPGLRGSCCDRKGVGIDTYWLWFGSIWGIRSRFSHLRLFETHR